MWHSMKGMVMAAAAVWRIPIWRLYLSNQSRHLHPQAWHRPIIHHPSPQHLATGSPSPHPQPLEHITITTLNTKGRCHADTITKTTMTCPRQRRQVGPPKSTSPLSIRLSWSDIGAFGMRPPRRQLRGYSTILITCSVLMRRRRCMTAPTSLRPLPRRIRPGL